MNIEEGVCIIMKKYIIYILCFMLHYVALAMIISLSQFIEYYYKITYMRKYNLNFVYFWIFLQILVKILYFHSEIENISFKNYMSFKFLLGPYFSL